MKAYTHGGDILTAQTGFQGEIVDFSANLNPLACRVRAPGGGGCSKGSRSLPRPLCRMLTEDRAAGRCEAGMGPLWQWSCGSHLPAGL